MYCYAEMSPTERRLQKKQNGYYHVLTSGDYQIYLNLLIVGGRRLLEPDPYEKLGKRPWEKKMQEWIDKLCLSKAFAAWRFTRSF